MRLKKYLIELKDAFQPFSGVWSEWIKSGSCGLTADEKYIIEVHSQNDFKFSIDHLLMFYSQIKRVKIVTKKLKESYPVFKEWAVSKFQLAIFRLDLGGDWGI